MRMAWHRSPGGGDPCRDFISGFHGPTGWYRYCYRCCGCAITSTTVITILIADEAIISVAVHDDACGGVSENISCTDSEWFHNFWKVF